MSQTKGAVSGVDLPLSDRPELTLAVIIFSLILQSRRTYLDSMSTGSTFKAIGKKALYSCEIPVYPNESQSRIVDQFHWIDHCLCWSRKQLSAFDDLVKSEFVEMSVIHVTRPQLVFQKLHSKIYANFE